MKTFSITMGVAALALVSLAGVARAGGDLDDGGNGYGDDTSYRRQSLSRLCYQHPEDPRCEAPSYRPRPRPRPAPSYSGGYSGGYGGGSCAATIRSAGKRNLIGAFARNSAVFSWQREVRAVHGPAYANWGSARRASVSCGPAGGALTGCVATASPCRS